MLYHFLVPLAKDHIVFNVFRYVTFRSFMALISGLVISLVIGPWLIRRLRVMQHGAETIREDTPERHRSKQGTPTMGGVVILTAIFGLDAAVGQSPESLRVGGHAQHGGLRPDRHVGRLEQDQDSVEGSRPGRSSCSRRCSRWRCCRSCSGSRGRRLAAGAGHPVLQGLAGQPRLVVDSLRDAGGGRRLERGEPDRRAGRPGDRTRS